MHCNMLGVPVFAGTSLVRPGCGRRSTLDPKCRRTERAVTASDGDCVLRQTLIGKPLRMADIRAALAEVLCIAAVLNRSRVGGMLRSTRKANQGAAVCNWAVGTVTECLVRPENVYLMGGMGDLRTRLPSVYLRWRICARERCWSPF
jgi:hypothetical protein